MCYGRFSEDGLEYVIERFDTPRPWINCLTNGKYCALVSHTGGGYSFLGGSRLGRITRAYPPDIMLGDRPGRYVYVRDMVTGDYWSLTWQPVKRSPSFWQARHGLGYTRIMSENMGISSEALYFVPLAMDVEVWSVRLRNTTHLVRDLGVFSYVEWCLGNQDFDLGDPCFSNLFNRVEEEAGVILATKGIWRTSGESKGPFVPWDKVAFMGASLDIASFEALREGFIGMYRSVQNPIGVERGYLSGSPAVGRDSCGALHVPVRISPGEEVEMAFVVGASASRSEAKAMALEFKKPEVVTEEWNRLNAYWKEYVSNPSVSTPDPDLDQSINVWNKYQNRFTFDWSRMSSYYLGGGNAVGFRHSCQDVLGVLPMEPERVKARLLDIASHQSRDGWALHSWDPVVGSGSRTGHSDDPIWLVLAVVSYIKETCDMEFLDVDCPFFDGETATMYVHLKKALDHSLGRLSPRGIPLIGTADWNEGLDQIGLQGNGESTVVAGLLGLGLRDMALLAKSRGDGGLQVRYQEAWKTLAAAVNEHLWDGDWYIRATNDNGEAIGSSQNAEGRVYLDAQAWLVLSGLAPKERAQKAMDAARQFLHTECGPALTLPAYTEPDAGIGLATRLSPGVKVNGATFNHAVAWAIMAEAIMGRGDVAYDYYVKALFLTRSKDAERYRAEPYVYAEYVHGPQSPYCGMGEFTWATGAAPWMFKVCTEWILGVRPELEGLMVDPCIPATWAGFRFKRDFRGASYDIEVDNTGGVSWGVKRVTVDGSEQAGQVLPDLRDGQVHKVNVTMGRQGE